MSSFNTNEAAAVSCINLEADPADLLSQIRDLFTRLGIDGRTLALTHQGGTYRVSCSEDTFVVYRTNCDIGGNHHVPGWPVCLVDRDNVFQEPTSQHTGGDHCNCGIGLKEWLHMVEQHKVNDMKSDPVK